MWYVETSVLACAVGMRHPSRDDCVRLVEAVAQGSLEAAISSEVVEELLFVLYKRNMIDAALQLSGHLQSLFSDLVPVTHKELSAACGILERHPELSSRDAVHAACAIEYQMTGIVTLDERFEALDSVLVVAPARCF